MRRIYLWSFLVVLWLCSPESTHAQIPRILGQGASASGQGNAFAAQADDPSAIHYNPAGMTQLPGIQIMAGSLFVGGTTKFTSPSGATATGDRAGSMAWPPPSQFFLTANLKDLGLSALGDLTAGLGVTVPFGSLSRYPENDPFRTATTFTTLPLMDIKPTIAYRLNDQLSVGLGADIYTFASMFGEGHAERKSIWPGGLGIPAGSIVELYGSDTAAGFNVSMMYTPFRNAAGKPLVNVGIVYRSQATLDLTGAFLANGGRVADANATLVLPQVITGGMAVWPIRDEQREWKLELDVDYVGWKSVRNLDVHLSNGVTIPQPQNWRGAYTIMIGTEYRWLQVAALPAWEVALRAGYTNQQTQMPDLTFDPGIPSADTHIPSIGLGLLCKKEGSFLGLTQCGKLGIGSIKPSALGLDLSFQTAIYEDRTVSGNRNPTVNGLYKTVFYSGGISLRVNY